MAKIVQRKIHTSGIALGGIGTGSVELFPDGEFHQWQISNQDRWAKSCGGEKVDNGESSTGALSFWVRTEKENSTPVVRKLGMKTEAEDFSYRLFPWNKPVEEITFDGRFPICDLTYEDSTLPVSVSMRAIAPFVPHNIEDSSVPGFYLDFTLANHTDESITVSLLSSLEPSFCNRGGFINRLYTDGETTGIFLDAVDQSDEKATEADRGSLCYSVEGGEISYITAESFRFIREYIAYSTLGISQESFLFGFRETGCLPNSTAGKRPRRIPYELSEFTDETIEDYLNEMYDYPFAQSVLGRVRYLRPSFPETRDEKIELLHAFRSSLESMGEDFGAAALCSKVKLAPGETRVIRFVLSWYFPNHYSTTGERLGHWYENRFADAKEVSKYLTTHRTEIADKAVAFSDLLYNTDLPEVYPDSWSIHLSTLVKNSWYLKDGKFGLWEGLGYCGFHTVDITYHASFGLLSLFPELQKQQMNMGIPFQREDGRVHHLFTPDLSHVDDSYERIDMNNQFVLMVCRDYLYTGDKAYLESMWIPVQKAMDSIEALDSDGDGLIDTDTAHNTYDAWHLSGIPAYIGFLWLSALKAAIKISEILGDTERSAHWETLLQRGLDSIDQKLWNGSYYDLWRRDDPGGTVKDGSLMTDQIDGEWFLRTAGIGGNLPLDRVREVLEAIFGANFDTETGLVNATTPQGQPVSLMTYKNCQSGAVWTGIGYTIAALAMSVGMSEIADAVVESINENQRRLGKIWEHWECGARYTRPMSSWTTMVAAAGLAVNAEKKSLTLCPIRSKLKVPLCIPGFIGTVEFDGDNCTITALDGTLDGWNICVPKSVGQVVVRQRY